MSYEKRIRQIQYPAGEDWALMEGAADIGLEADEEVKSLRDLVRHCWIHSGYRNCGYNQMTTKQKNLYDSLTSQAINEAD